MSRIHRGRRRESSTCQSATQIVFPIAMVARKIGTSQTENGFYLGKRYMHGQQFSGAPQINDAPVNRRKAFVNVPTLLIQLRQMRLPLPEP